MSFEAFRQVYMPSDHGLPGPYDRLEKFNDRSGLALYEHPVQAHGTGSILRLEARRQTVTSSSGDRCEIIDY